MNLFFFAAFFDDPDEPLLAIGRLSREAKERLIILGAIAVVILIVLCWAAFFRKRPKHRRGTIKRSKHSFRQSFIDGITELKRLFAQRERQRKKIHHRPRNPTRAEIGGLPAPREPATTPATDDAPSPGGNP